MSKKKAKPAPKKRSGVKKLTIEDLKSPKAGDCTKSNGGEYDSTNGEGSCS